VAPLPGVGLGAVDIQETPNAYIFKVDVPGLNKDDVKGAPPSLGFLGSGCRFTMACWGTGAWYGMLVAVALVEGRP